MRAAQPLRAALGPAGLRLRPAEGRCSPDPGLRRAAGAPGRAPLNLGRAPSAPECAVREGAGSPSWDTRFPLTCKAWW